jgi:hypothetical protein
MSLVPATHENGGRHGFAEMPSLRRFYAQRSNLGASSGVHPYPCTGGTGHGHSDALQPMRSRFCSKRVATHRGRPVRSNAHRAVGPGGSILGLGVLATSLSMSTWQCVPPNPSIERTCSSGLRPPPHAAHVKRYAAGRRVCVASFSGVVS